MGRVSHRYPRPLLCHLLARQILSEDKGTKKMQEVWNAIREGADAYLSRQLRRILPLIAVDDRAVFERLYRPPHPRSDRTISWYVGKPAALVGRPGAGYRLRHGCAF